MVAIAPHDIEELREIVESIKPPYPMLADGDRSVFLQYEVQSRVWSLGQRPGLYIIDREGVIRWAHVGSQQWEIPRNTEVLAILDDLNGGAPANP